MQEIEYEDGTKTEELFSSFEAALKDAERKSRTNTIKKLTITRIIPSKKRKR